MSFSARDQSQVELIFVAGYVVTVDRFSCGLLKSGEVHDWLSHHIITIMTRGNCLQRKK